MENEPASPKPEDAPPTGGWSALHRISRWYWGAIGVIALAALAQFFQSAPVTTPATVVSATLAPGATLQIAYPRDVRPVLRPADKTPLALTLQGIGAVTYTVALSTSAPLLFTDSDQQSVDPRAELAVNSCCQSSALFYPQASSAAWHQQAVEVSAYAAPTGAPLPATPTLTFTLYLEPVWWTWGRRALALFTELGLAVSVALALGGWAMEQQRNAQQQRVAREREQRENEHQQRQREAQNQEALWQSQIEHAQRIGEHNLLAGVSELLALKRTLSSPENDPRRTRLDTVLQGYRFIAADPDSLAVEQCLEHIATRLQAGQSFSQEELSALSYLFDPESTGDAVGEIATLVDVLSRRNASTGPEHLRQTAINLYDKFVYSLAIRNLTIELIREWYAKIQNDGVHEDIDAVLTPIVHLMSDPRLAHIPFRLRTHLYRLPPVAAYRYPWANPDDIAVIAERLLTLLKVNLQDFAEAPANSWRPRLPSLGFIRQPRLLKFPVHEDADCGAHLLHAHLIATAADGLQRSDGAQEKSAGALSDEGAGKLLSIDFIPFPVFVPLTIDTTLSEQRSLEQLMPLVTAITEEWLALLACSPSLWAGLTLARRNTLATMLQMIVHTKAELQYRLHQHRQSYRCGQQVIANKISASAAPASERQRDDAIINKLTASITSLWQNASSLKIMDSERLGAWLTLRPDYFTHTVVVALMYPATITSASTDWWRAWLHLTDRLRIRNVVVHLLTSQLPEMPLLHRLAVDCTVSKVQLAKLLDEAFGYKSGSFAQDNMHAAGADGCKIDALSRLLDDDSFDLVDEVTDALLHRAAGSPSCLLHMMHLILKHRLANLQKDAAEFKLSHLDIMDIVQTYPKDQ